jgi:rhodanese-related sulfurtransferase
MGRVKSSIPGLEQAWRDVRKRRFKPGGDSRSLAFRKHKTHFPIKEDIADALNREAVQEYALFVKQILGGIRYTMIRMLNRHLHPQDKPFVLWISHGYRVKNIPKEVLRLIGLEGIPMEACDICDPYVEIMKRRTHINTVIDCRVPVAEILDKDREHLTRDLWQVDKIWRELDRLGVGRPVPTSSEGKKTKKVRQPPKKLEDYNLVSPTAYVRRLMAQIEEMDNGV